MKFPNRTLICWTTLLTVSFACFSWGSEGTLDERISQYEEMMEAFENGSTKATIALGEKYIKALDHLEGPTRTNKDFSGLLLIKKEKRRFSNEQKLTQDHINTTHHSLGSLQQKVLQAFQKLDTDFYRKKYGLMSEMVARLEKHTANPLAGTDPESAKTAEDLLERIKADPFYAAVQKRLRDREIAKIWDNSSSSEETPALASTRPGPAVVTAKPMLEVSLVKVNLSKLARNGDYDDQVQNLQFRVKIQSREFVKNYTNLTVSVWAVGKGVESKREMKILLKDTMKIESLPRGARTECETKVIRNLYDDNRSAQYGHKYYGYVLDIRDKEGTLLYSKSSPSTIQRGEEKVREESEGASFIL